MAGLVSKQLRKVTKGKDVKEEGKLINGPIENWEQYLIPAPYTVEILAMVLQISTERDFSLEHNPPRDGFKLIRTPTSFRACLVQVANEGYRAFKEAHESMERIRQRCQLMPADFKEALQTLFQGDADEVEELLPISLGAINEHAIRCEQLANGVEQKFGDVGDLIGELLEVTTANKGHYEDALQEAQIRKEISEMKKERLGKQEKEAEKMRNELEKAEEEAEQQYKDAYDAIPSGWEVMGMNFVDGLLKTVNNVVGMVALPATILEAGKEMATGQGNGEGGDETQTKAFDPTEPTVLEMIKQTGKIQSIITPLKAMFPLEKDDSGEKKRKFVNEKGTKKVLAMTLALMEEVKKAAETADAKSKQHVILKKKATEVADEAIEYIKGLQSVVAENKEAELDHAKSWATLEKMWGVSGVLEILTQSLTHETSLGTSGPNAKKAKPKTSSRSEAKSVGQSAVETAKFKVEASKQYLKDKRKQFEQAQANYQASQDKMTEVLAELTVATKNEINFESIKKVLNKGIQALSDLQSQWAKLVSFFMVVKTYISVTMNVTVKKFLGYARSGEKKRLGGMTIKKLSQDHIYNNAFKAIKIAYYVEDIAGAYVRMSSEHVMHRIAGIAKILGYDGDTEKDKIAAEVNKIRAGCQDAQRQIKNEMEAHKRLFESQASRRFSQIKKSLDESLPDPPPETLKAIANAGKLTKKLLAGDEDLEDDSDDDDDIDESELY